MIDYCLVKIVTSNYERFLKKCYGLGIDIYYSFQKDKALFIKIKKDDINKLRHVFFARFEVVDYYGFYGIKEKVKKNSSFLVSIILGLILIYFFSRFILSVEVIHSSSHVRNLVLSVLESEGIKKYSWKKSYHDLSVIKEDILKKYQDEIEWLEIEELGMKYIVRVEERKREDKIEENETCHIIAKKDGIVKEVNYSKGQALVSRNDFVRKGDILISGVIYKDEEEKGFVCALGDVYAEVWYNVKVTFPLVYEKNIRTGKVRFNIKFKDDFIFKSRINNYEEEDYKLFSFWQNDFYFVKQLEVRKETFSYSEEEALDKALKMALEKLNISDEESILSKKVLKKEEKNGIMSVDIFVSVKESIGISQKFERIKGEENENA